MQWLTIMATQIDKGVVLTETIRQHQPKYQMICSVGSTRYRHKLSCLVEVEWSRIQSVELQNIAL